MLRSRQEKKNYSMETVLKAIKDCDAIVSNVAKKLKCEWHTAQRYLDKWETTRKAFNNESENILDFTESMLMQNIKKGDMQAIKFKLSSRHGRKRGYGEKQEIELIGNKEKPVIVERHIKLDRTLKNMTDEDRKLMRDILRRNNGQGDATDMEQE